MQTVISCSFIYQHARQYKEKKNYKQKRMIHCGALYLDFEAKLRIFLSHIMVLNITYANMFILGRLYRGRRLANKTGVGLENHLKKGFFRCLI